jgi:hypothetical protein
MKREILVGKPEGIIWGVRDVDGSLVLIWALEKECLCNYKTLVVVRNYGLLFVDAVPIPNSKLQLS